MQVGAVPATRNFSRRKKFNILKWNIYQGYNTVIRYGMDQV